MRPTTAPADLEDVALVFFENPQGGSPIGKLDGKYVILRREHEHTPHVQPGESWLCDLWLRARSCIAEPKERLDPPAPGNQADAGEEAPALSTAPHSEDAPDLLDSGAAAADPLVRVVPRAQGDPHAAGNALEAIADFLGDERLLLMVHAPQVEAATKDLGAGVDWVILPELLNSAATLTAAIYHDADAGDAERGALHDMLSRLGYVIRPKELRATTRRAREEALEILDTEFIIDTLESAFRTDLVFLAVNDAKFLPLVRTLQRRGKRVYVISSRNVLAPALGLAANKPILYLEDINAVLREADELPREGKP